MFPYAQLHVIPYPKNSTFEITFTPKVHSPDVAVSKKDLKFATKESYVAMLSSVMFTVCEGLNSSPQTQSQPQPLIE